MIIELANADNSEQYYQNQSGHMQGHSSFFFICFLIFMCVFVWFQVEEVPVVHRELPGEKPQPETQHRAAPETSVHQRSAQREAGPHPAEGPHRPHQEEERREG